MYNYIYIIVIEKYLHRWYNFIVNWEVLIDYKIILQDYKQSYKLLY